MNNKYITLYGSGRNQYMILSKLTAFIVITIFTIINALLIFGFQTIASSSFNNFMIYIFGVVGFLVTCPILFLDFFLFFFFKKNFFRSKIVKMNPNKLESFIENSSRNQKNLLAELYLTFLKVQLEDDERINKSILKINEEIKGKADIIERLKENSDYISTLILKDFTFIMNNFDGYDEIKDFLLPDENIEKYLRSQYFS